MIGQTEVIIGTHVQDALAIGHRDVRVLRRGDDALGFVETLRPNFIECFRKLLFEFGKHN